MADIQLFSNNARSTLASDVIDSDDQISLFDSSSFAPSSPGYYELATLSNASGTLIEIVKIIDNDTVNNFITVQRAYEGNNQGSPVALNWPEGTIIEGRITAQTLSSFTQGLGNNGAIAANSVALNGIENRVEQTMMVAAFPCVPSNVASINEEVLTQAPETVLGSPYFDLGYPPAWASEVSYYNGAIVQPTTPDGYQYLATQLLYQTPGVSGAVEPTWDSFTDDEGITWIRQDPIGGYLMQSPPVGSVFIPTLFGFVSHSIVSGTLTPINISIGVSGDSERYVAEVDGVVTITGSNQFCTWGVDQTVAVQSNEQLLFTVTSQSTTGRCVGRFFVRGFFVELPDDY